MMNCAREAPEARVAGLVPVGNLRGDRMPVSRVVNARSGRMPVNRAACALSVRVPAGKAVMREDVDRSLRKAEVNARPREKIPRAVAVRRLSKDNKFFLRRQIALAGH